jgi:hypothetical protein
VPNDTNNPRDSTALAQYIKPNLSAYAPSDFNDSHVHFCGICFQHLTRQQQDHEFELRAASRLLTSAVGEYWMYWRMGIIGASSKQRALSASN